MYRVVSICGVLLLIAFAGCGGAGDLPDLIPVKGTVKLDGKPLANATVTFEPPDGARAATGTTDENGNYELIYSSTNTGALAGTYTVRIDVGEGMPVEYPEGVDPDKLSPAEKEKYAPKNVPAKYNRSSELKAEVKEGTETYDFDLKSDG